MANTTASSRTKWALRERNEATVIVNHGIEGPVWGTLGGQNVVILSLELEFDKPEGKKVDSIGVDLDFQNIASNTKGLRVHACVPHGLEINSSAMKCSEESMFNPSAQYGGLAVSAGSISERTEQDKMLSFHFYSDIGISSCATVSFRLECSKGKKKERFRRTIYAAVVIKHCGEPFEVYPSVRLRFPWLWKSMQPPCLREDKPYCTLLVPTECNQDLSEFVASLSTRIERQNWESTAIELPRTRPVSAEISDPAVTTDSLDQDSATNRSKHLEPVDNRTTFVQHHEDPNVVRLAWVALIIFCLAFFSLKIN